MTAALWWVNHIELWGLVLTKWLVCVMSQSFLALESTRLIATTMKPAVRHAIAWVARTRRMHARRGFIHEYNVRKPDLFTRPGYSGNRTLNLHSELDMFQLYDWWDVVMLRWQDVIIIDSLGMWKHGWIALRYGCFILVSTSQGERGLVVFTTRVLIGLPCVHAALANNIVRRVDCENIEMVVLTVCMNELRRSDNEQDQGEPPVGCPPSLHSSWSDC